MSDIENSQHIPAEGDHNRADHEEPAQVNQSEDIIEAQALDAKAIGLHDSERKHTFAEKEEGANDYPDNQRPQTTPV